MLTDRNFWFPQNVRAADINQIKRIMDHHLTGKGEGILAKAIQNRIPARIGGLTDCFQPVEKTKKITLQLIRYLNSIDYPYLIVTKSDLISSPIYLREIRNDLAYVQITVTTINRTRSRQLEPNAPSPKKRIDALRELNQKGIWTAGRISPIIPNVTVEDCFDIIHALEQIGTPHIIFEFFRGTHEMINRVQRATGAKISGLQKRGPYFRLSSEAKDSFYKKIEDRLNGGRMLFTFCSDGDPVPFHLNCTTNCCGSDAITRLIPLTRFNRGNERVASAVYQELQKKGIIRTTDLKPYFCLSDDIFLESWNNGLFEHYVPGCSWSKKTRTYSNNSKATRKKALSR